MVLACAFFGLKRFDDIQRELGIATNILAQRLELLVRQRILERRPYSEQPRRFEYRLTAKGRDLYPWALLMNDWGDRWLASAAGPPYYVVHSACAKHARPQVRCSHCHGELGPGTVTGKRARPARVERGARGARGAR